MRAAGAVNAALVVAVVVAGCTSDSPEPTAQPSDVAVSQEPLSSPAEGGLDELTRRLNGELQVAIVAAGYQALGGDHDIGQATETITELVEGREVLLTLALWVRADVERLGLYDEFVASGTQDGGGAHVQVGTWPNGDHAAVLQCPDRTLVIRSHAATDDARNAVERAASRLASALACTGLDDTRTACDQQRVLHQADVDGDGLDDQVAFDGRSMLVVCTASGGQHTVAWSGMGEASHVVDLQGDGTTEIFFGGTTVSARGMDVAAWHEDTLVAVTTADGQRLSLWDGVAAYDQDGDVVVEYDTWSCQDIDADGIREIVTEHGVLDDGTDTYTIALVAYRIERARAVEVRRWTEQVARQDAQPSSFNCHQPLER